MNHPKRISKKLAITALLLSLTAIALTAGLLLLSANRYHLFLFAEKTGFLRGEVKITEKQTETLTEKTMEELKGDIRITFDQSMMLVNTDYMLEEDFVPAISEYKDSGVLMNNCMKDAYASLSAAVSEETGVKLYVSSHFRTAEKQAALYREDPETATIPGASEHQTGLCVDVYVAYYAGDGFIKSPAGRFVNRHCHEYGFIIRYPVYGEESTGIRYEPWHIRYVGHPHAEIIMGNHLTLEEYIFSLERDVWYQSNGYLICKTDADDALPLPAEFQSAVISADNNGHYIITVRL
ncbi:MAG: M15 family metallopeptidase [Clostridia bacterium]|nr:M15 family metallopeptidase [Clostridia bacterium]